MRIREINLRGQAGKLFESKATESLISGPAGTGKTLASLLKLWVDANTLENLRCLILRKTRVALTESALVTFERDVLGAGHPLIGKVTRAGRRVYGPLANGSEIVVGGLSGADSETKVMSTDWDRIYVMEAIELTEGEWEALTTRISRAGRPGQIWGDTNPDKPKHWLKLRCDRGQTRMFESRHEDNPLLFEKRWTDAGPAFTMTPAGKAYLAILDGLSGTRKDRLRYGRWVQAEGVVYDEWDASVHVVDAFTPPRSWPTFLGVDFGFTNPFVCHFWREDPDGRLWLEREIYMTGRLVADHARRIKDLLGGRRPHDILADPSDAEGRATLERALGMRVTKADNKKAAGIQEVKQRLARARDGKPRVFVMRDALDERDPELISRKLPTSTLEEVDGYVWNTTGGRKKGEEPIDRDNHGMDAMRYVCAHTAIKRSGGWIPSSADVKTAADRAGRW